MSNGYLINDISLTSIAYVYDNTTYTINNYIAFDKNLGNYLYKWESTQGTLFKLGPTGFLNSGTDIGNELLGAITQINGNVGNNGSVINYSTANTAGYNGGIYYEGAAASINNTFKVNSSVKFISGFIIGAGGGGGGTRNGSQNVGGGGGGGGGCIYFKLPVDTNTTITITCGGGGNGGSTSNTNSWGTGGGTGGSSTVNYSNYTLTAPGGNGGGGGWSSDVKGNGGVPSSSAPTGMNTTNYAAYNGNNGANSANVTTVSGNVGITSSLLGTTYPASSFYTNYAKGGAGGLNNNQGNSTNGIGYRGNGGLVRVYFLMA